jgi:predicted ABC-type ATPase
VSPLPRVLVFAGPNGSGKSTITRAWHIVGVYINADDIKAASQCSDLDAAEAAEQARRSCLIHRRDFTFETVLSTRRNMVILQDAKELGYQVTGVFVITVSADINVARVRSRVLGGGHDVPPDKTKARYSASLANLPEFVGLCDEAWVFDNTDLPTVVYTRSDGEETYFPNDYWDEASLRSLIRP